MSRILSIDYGLKKVGLAISDETQSIALPFKVLENQGDKKLAQKIKEICFENGIKEIIIGIPKTLSGEEGEQAKKVKNFIEILKTLINIPIIEQDERMTSKLAQRFIEKNKRQDDRVAAQILLHDYLDGSR